jgi:hypothetical protein
MSSLNINSLYETMYSRNIKRYEKFDEILKKLHNRIKYHASNEKTYCFFQIPEFIIGVPLYNINDLKEYLIKSLQKDGFKYIYVEPNWLFVTWEIKSKKNMNNKKNIKKEKQNGEYKLIDEYKPSGNLYTDYDMGTIREKMNDLL